MVATSSVPHAASGIRNTSPSSDTTCRKPCSSSRRAIGSTRHVDDWNETGERQGTRSGIVQAARTLPGARPDRIGLFGHSRGGGPILSYILGAGNVQAVVLNSAGYPSGLSTRVNAPILILHGTAD